MTAMFLELALNVLILQTSRETNVALGQNGTYCGYRQLSTVIVDGVTDKHKAERVLDRCPGNAYVDIFLTLRSNVYRVVVYEGIDFVEGQLDYFIVSTYLNETKSICAHYPADTRSPRKEEGMVVNCDPANPSDRVRVQSRKNVGLVISEIEVYAFDNLNIIFNGCFRDFPYAKSYNLYFKDCRVMCSSSHFYFAMQGTMNCFCSNDYLPQAEVSVRKCDVRCLSDHANCGGLDHYAVYIANVAVPIYLGCYPVDPTYAKADGFKGPMSPEICVHICDNFLFAILTNNDTCLCSNIEMKYKNFPPVHDKCSNTCTEDGSPRCSGDGYMSLYRGCFKNPNTVRCSQLYQCKETFDAWGTCSDGSCRAEFSSPRCTKDKDQPCPNWEVCNDPHGSGCALVYGWPSCTCYQGYTKGKDGRCQGIHSCDALKFCPGRQSYVCHRFNLTQVCHCLPGHVEVLYKSCRDVDECHYRPCGEHSECINTIGSHSCSCKYGYSEDEHGLCLENESIRALGSMHGQGTSQILYGLAAAFLLLTICGIWIFPHHDQTIAQENRDYQL